MFSIMCRRKHHRPSAQDTERRAFPARSAAIGVTKMQRRAPTRVRRLAERAGGSFRTHPSRTFPAGWHLETSQCTHRPASGRNRNQERGADPSFQLERTGEGCGSPETEREDLCCTTCNRAALGKFESGGRPSALSVRCVSLCRYRAC